MRTCLDLFSGLGGFSAAFADADGWEVVTVDVEERFGPDIHADVMDLRPSDLPDADVVLASPPCNCFTRANNGYHIRNGEMQTDAIRLSVVLVHHTIGLIKAAEPDYWFLENPQGYLRKFIGAPDAVVTYCQYGEDYRKATDLWGNHPATFGPEACPPGANCHSEVIGNKGADAPSDAAERAKVPRELSEAVLEAVEDAYANPPPEQSSLLDVEVSD